MKTLCLTVRFGPLADSQTLWDDQPPEAAIVAAVKRCVPEADHAAAGPWLSAADFLSDLMTRSQGYDELILAAGDAPLLRRDLCDQVKGLHRQYRADYTFADGFPIGLSPEMVHPRILAVLAEWEAKRPDSLRSAAVNRETLFQLLSLDINQFDVETVLSPVDLRTRRISLTLDTRRNRRLAERWSAYANRDLPEFLGLLEKSGFAQRTLPAVLHVQLTDDVRQTPLWSPLRRREGGAPAEFLPRSRWTALLDEVVAWCGDITLMPSLWGEPSLHPEIVDLLADALARPGVSVCLETSGLGWSGHNLERLSGSSGIDWIVELDSQNEETYRALRGEGFEEAQAFTERLLGLFPNRVWPQTVRMNENEQEMDEFYRFWKEKAGRVIIQKYDTFSGRLPDRKPSNLAPWQRHSCWHIARDLALALDGTVTVCRDDLSRQLSLGRWPAEPLVSLWDRGEALLRRHDSHDLPEVCRACDEWYTYHF